MLRVAPGAVLDEIAPEIDDLGSRGGRLGAGQALAHHESEGILQGSVGAVRDLFVFAATVVAILQHGRDVGGDAGHAPRTDRFHARLLDRIEHGAGGLTVRGEPPVKIRVVTGEAQSHGIGIAAQDRHILRGQPTGRLRQARLLLAHEHRTVRREGNLEIGFAGDRLHGAGDGALQRLRRRFLLLTWLAVRDGHLTSLTPRFVSSPRRRGSITTTE
jgi:hypothetical protein